MEAPKCCSEFMELKSVCLFKPTDFDNGDKFFFQCVECGEVKKKAGIIPAEDEEDE